MISRFFTFVLALCPAFGFAHEYLDVKDFSDTREALEFILTEEVKSDFLTVEKTRIYHTQAIREFYKKRFYLAVWLDTALVTDAIDWLDSSVHDGLQPKDYHLAKLKSMRAVWSSSKPDHYEVAKLDVLLTDAFLLYANHLFSGKVDPESIDSKWHMTGREGDMLRFLRALTVHKNFQYIYDELRPTRDSYLGLKAALRHYRALEGQTKFPSIFGIEKLEVGATDPMVAKIRERLFITGELTPYGTNEDHEYDSVLMQGVMKFQDAHGLAVDGVIGPATVRELNVPLKARIDQIIANMERHRWLTPDYGPNYILVNIADYKMRVYRSDTVDFEMNVVVGKPYRSTPAFSATMTHLVFNPVWTVPPTILKEDVIPEVQESTEYLKKQNMNVYTRGGEKVHPDSIDWSGASGKNFPYVIRQASGSYNALGLIKFMFPNKYYIYIHDSPKKYLFQRSERAFSSGCIRVADAQAFANYLLVGDSSILDSTWTAHTTRDFIDAGKQKIVSLSTPIPVHIIYLTAWVENNGSLHFRKDIYKRDETLIEALQKKP